MYPDTIPIIIAIGTFNFLRRRHANPRAGKAITHDMNIVNGSAIAEMTASEKVDGGMY